MQFSFVYKVLKKHVKQECLKVFSWERCKCNRARAWVVAYQKMIVIIHCGGKRNQKILLCNPGGKKVEGDSRGKVGF